MSDYHIYRCDLCGVEDEVWCDGRGAAKLPRDWQQRGNQDWCESCIEDKAQDDAAVEVETADNLLA